MNHTTHDVETYLREHIPLSQAMGVSVLSCGDDGVLLAAPLAPNINHRETAFGGSISSLAILAAWTLIHVRLTTLKISARIVIQRSSMEYQEAVIGDFEAFCPTPTAEAWGKFLRTLQRYGKARLALTAEVRCGSLIAATFTGEYVAIGM
jgi:thioesterase domain-containing protein